MSKAHPYRIQLHCDRAMHADVMEFANKRGLSHSAAARVLIERALVRDSDTVPHRIERLEGYLNAILHAVTFSRVLTSDLAKKSGIDLSSDEFQERIGKIMQRYRGK